MSSAPLLPYKKLISQAQKFAISYENLTKRFSEFADHANELRKQGPVANVIVEKDASRPQFDVAYLGRRFRFELKLQTGDAGDAFGTVICSEVLTKILRPVHQFEINEQGDSNVKPPDSEGPIGCEVRQGAWYLLLNSMQIGFRKQ